MSRHFVTARRRGGYLYRGYRVSRGCSLSSQRTAPRVGYYEDEVAFRSAEVYLRWFVHGRAHGIQILTIREFGTPGGAVASVVLTESSEVWVGAEEEAEEAGDSMSGGGKAARGRELCGGKRAGLGADRSDRDLSTQAPVTAASMLLTSTGSISVLFEALRGVTSMPGRPRRSAQCASRTSRLM